MEIRIEILWDNHDWMNEWMNEWILGHPNQFGKEERARDQHH